MVLKGYVPNQIQKSHDVLKGSMLVLFLGIGLVKRSLNQRLMIYEERDSLSAVSMLLKDRAV